MTIAERQQLLRVALSLADRTLYRSYCNPSNYKGQKTKLYHIAQRAGG
jgi:hypothetical protein